MLRFTLLIALALLLAGCGDKGPVLYPVEGVVTLNGAPVEKAYVSFMPAEGQTQPASGETDGQGKFKLKTTIGPQEYPGAFPGKYDVIITKSVFSGVTPDKHGLSGEATPEGIKTEWIIPEKYSTTKTSELHGQVAPNSPPLKFDLKK